MATSCAPSAPSGDAAPESGTSVVRILRERWLTLTLVTMLAAAGSLGALWRFVGAKYEVSATVHVAPVVRPILFSDPDVDITRNYRQYVLTEAANIVGSAVIDAAINMPEVRALPIVAESDDPMATIQDAIRVQPIQGTELLKVSMSGGEPQEMATLINAVLTAYLTRKDVKQREWDEKILSSLKAEQTEHEAKLKVKARQLRESSVEQGLSSAEDIGLLVDRWMSDMQEQLTQASKDKALAEARLAILNSEAGAPDADLDPAATEDALGRDLELSNLKDQLRTVELGALGDAAAGRGPGHPDVLNRPALIAALNERIDRRGAELQKTYVDSRRRELESSHRTATVTLRVLEQEMQKLSEKRAGLAGQRSVLEDLRHERERIETALNQVNQKIWNVEVEQNRASRITVDSPPRVPEKPNLDKRMKYSAVAVLMSVMLGAGTAFLRHRMDTSFQTPEEIPERLGVRVLGSVQFVDQQRDEPRVFDERFTEPIRGISTTLLAGSAARGVRTRLITSPTPGSGKTSLALQLARSLAATGRRVLLVDADNVGQGVTRRLQMQNQPGLTDLLLGQRTAEETVYSGDVPGLHVLPSGKLDERFGDFLRAKETNSRLRIVFASYDEVIVDSPPVLAKSDTVALARIVDETVLILRAGKSTKEEAYAAQQSLAAVGGNVTGVILNAVDPRRVRYGYYYNYHYTGSA